jgi:hypothetical protein
MSKLACSSAMVMMARVDMKNAGEKEKRRGYHQHE